MGLTCSGQDDPANVLVDDFESSDTRPTWVPITEVIEALSLGPVPNTVYEKPVNFELAISYAEDEMRYARNHIMFIRYE